MDFEKKVLVLKQVTEGYSINGKPTSGIARLERENGVTTLYLTLVNYAPMTSGEFYVFVCDKTKKLRYFTLGKSPAGITKNLEFPLDISSGLCFSIVFIKDDLPILVSYACADSLYVSIPDFKKLIAEQLLKDRRQNVKAVDPFVAAERLNDCQKIHNEYNEKSQPSTTETKVDYNDEIVATENYYNNDLELSKKLEIINQMDKDDVRTKNVNGYSEREETKEESQQNANFLQDEENFNSGENYSADNPYFLSVRAELDDIFQKFPEEKSLIRSVPDSKWAKINYSEQKYYVVGVIYENNKEKYICYGVPATYSTEPPKQLKGYCSFIPISVFDMKGDGFWMMFQDAVSGECVNINK